MTNIFLENVYLEFPLSYGKSIRTEFIDRFIKKRSVSILFSS